MAASPPTRMCLDAFRAPTDKKRYRLVTMSNGLEVLLIQSADPAPHNPESGTLCSSTSSETDTDSDSLEEGAINDQAKMEERRDGRAPQAGACLAVGVGSLSDPKGLHGLAHYLEHMLFMGSARYPAEDAFEAFLSAHGGASNGATECESTRFLFDVDARHLEQALDMFAQLFVAPLLRREAMTRELRAVEAEFQRVRQNDAVKLQQVQCETSVAAHAYTRCFTWGNRLSLQQLPEAEGVDVREEMLSFFKTHYLAPNMKLCVYGQESLDELETYVVQSFSEIPCRRDSLTKPKAEPIAVPFGSEAGQRPMLLRVVPSGEQRTMRLYWMLPAMLKSYRQKPWEYVAYVLGHEGPGSMTAALRERQWATDVETGVSDRDAYEFGTFGTLFEVRVTLTLEGLRCWEQVVQVVFEVLQAFQDLATKHDGGSLPSWVFYELQAASEMDFRFQEEDQDVLGLCRELSDRMLPRHGIQRENAGDLLRYDVLQGAFDVTEVYSVLAGLSVANTRVVLMASSFREELEPSQLRYEKWLGTAYTVTVIPDAVLAQWGQKATRPAKLSPLPTPNPFMPRDFAVLPTGNGEEESDANAPPKLVLSTATTQLWYKRDRTFLVPKTSASFLLALPTPTSAVTHMLAELHVELVRQQLQQALEQASIANLDVELTVRDEALEVVISGFSDSLPALVRVVMSAVVSPTMSPKASQVIPELAIAREELETEYSNATLLPADKARELRLQLLETGAVPTSDKLQALQLQNGRDGELMRDLANFAVSVLGRGDNAAVMQCLVLGNITREAAVALALDVEAARSGEAPTLSQLEQEPEPEDLELLTPRCHTIALPATKNGLLLRRLSERHEESNSIVEVYFQLGKVSVEDRAYAILLRALLAQPLFHELRTRQQLGYAINCSVRDTHDVLGLSVSVQSASHAASDVARRLDAFLHHAFPREYLLSELRLTPKYFREHVLALQRSVARPDTTLVEQSERYWEEIVSGRLDFHLDESVAKALQSCTRHGLFERYERWLLGSTSSSLEVASPKHHHTKATVKVRSHGLRKLRVHIVGRQSPHMPLEQLVPPDEAPQLIAGDLHEFKHKLQCHCTKS